MAVTLSGIIIGCLQCLIRKWRRKKIFKTAKNPTKHTHLKIMKVVMNPGGHRTVLFSRAEKKRNREGSTYFYVFNKQWHERKIQDKQ